MSAPVEAAANGQRLGLRLFLKEENLTLDDAAKFIGATQTLLREIEKSVTGKKRARLKWQVVKLGYECDGCGVARPQEHADWKHTEDGKDFCLPCTRSDQHGGEA